MRGVHGGALGFDPPDSAALELPDFSLGSPRFKDRRRGFTLSEGQDWAHPLILPRSNVRCIWVLPFTDGKAFTVLEPNVDIAVRSRCWTCLGDTSFDSDGRVPAGNPLYTG
jgi:hypothetical protein